MRMFDADISDLAFCFLKDNRTSLTSIEHANELFQNKCGILNFFTSESELSKVVLELNETFSNEACESHAE